VKSPTSNPDAEIVDALVLPDLQKRFVKARWLHQLDWLEAQAGSNRRRYYCLRTLAIAGGVIVPALVSLDVRGDVPAAISWVTFALSLVVALATALEGFFRHGDRWRNYRRTAEALKSQGWQFFQLAGPYAGFADHASAHAAFAADVEMILDRDVERYITRIAVEQRPGEGGEGDGAPKPG
jgi:hypothetical protein